MYARFEDFDAARRAVAGFLAHRLPADAATDELEHVELVSAPQHPEPAALHAGPSRSAGMQNGTGANGAGAAEGNGADRPLVSLLSALLATVRTKELEAARERQRLEEAYAEAQRDALTGLCNRAAWDRALTREERRCNRYGDPAGVVLVDLDDLKLTNDRFGHAAGDELLRCAARTLLSASRKPDVVARLGGDEFAILALNCDRSGLSALERRVRTALTRKYARRWVRRCAPTSLASPERCAWPTAPCTATNSAARSASPQR